MKRIIFLSFIVVLVFLLSSYVFASGKNIDKEYIANIHAPLPPDVEAEGMSITITVIDDTSSTTTSSSKKD